MKIMGLSCNFSQLIQSIENKILNVIESDS